MRLKTALLLLLGVLVVTPLLAFLLFRWHLMVSPPPKPDFARFGRYMTALNLSHVPVAVQIRKQIADGPAALVREKAAAQTDGIDLDPAHLQKPLPPADRNAAPLYDRWEALRHTNPMALPEYAETLNNRYAYTPAQLARVQALLDAHRDAMALLHQAADRPLCVYREDWQHVGTQTPSFSRYAGLREAARELNTESYLLAKQGRYAEAVANQARGFRVAEHAAAQPTTVGYLVGIAVEAITLAGMESTLDIAGLNPAVAAQVQQTVATHHSRLSLKYALSGEAVISTEELSALPSRTPAVLASVTQDMSGMGSGASPGINQPARFSPEEQRFLAQLAAATGADDLSWVRAMIAVADAAPSVRHRFEAQLTRETAAAKSDPAHQLNPVSTLTDLYLPNFHDLAAKGEQMAAEEQMMMAAAEALETKGRTGAFPVRLTGHYPDPFADGKPLGYRRERANGFVVYSVGPTGKFGGGLPGQHRWNSSEVAFRYPGPARMTVPRNMLK